MVLGYNSSPGLGSDAVGGGIGPVLIGASGSTGKGTGSDSIGADDCTGARLIKFPYESHVSDAGPGKHSTFPTDTSQGPHGIHEPSAITVMLFLAH